MESIEHSLAASLLSEKEEEDVGEDWTFEHDTVVHGLSHKHSVAEFLIAPSIQPQIVFVGGGPVGLWTAVQVKLRSPKVNITVFEKYSQYQRSHVLRLKAASFAHASHDPRLQTLIKELPLTVRTNELEDKLLALANELGIRVTFQNISSTDEIFEKFPSTKIVVGSDGSHSVVRGQIFDDVMSVKQSLQHIIDIKYEVYGEGQKMGNMTQLYPTLKIMNHIAEEHIGKMKNEISPVTLRLLVSEEEFEPLKNASFKSPFYIPTHHTQIPPKVLESIRIWMNVKTHLFSERRVPGSEKLTALDLAVYRAHEFVKIDPAHARAFCLVGDAAFGVPFFRALNNGLLSGTKLAKKLAKIANSDFASLEPLNRYNTYVSDLANAEIDTAKRKEVVLKSAGAFVAISGSVPWQINKWNNSKVHLFKETDPGFFVHTENGMKLTCGKCKVMYEADFNPPGNCAHSGAWHVPADCKKINCTNAAKLKQSHWSCCNSEKENPACIQSKPHEDKPAMCSVCFAEFWNSDPNECIHKEGWHSLQDCSMKCAVGLGKSIGHKHWGCCYIIDKENLKCPKNKHTPFPY